MSHVPYGYRIENGKAVIDEEKAKQVKKIYKAYLSGLAYVPAAEAAGLAFAGNMYIITSMQLSG